jgi:hypothetical protein
MHASQPVLLNDLHDTPDPPLKSPKERTPTRPRATLSIYRERESRKYHRATARHRSRLSTSRVSPSTPHRGRGPERVVALQCRCRRIDAGLARPSGPSSPCHPLPQPVLMGVWPSTENPQISRRYAMPDGKEGTPGEVRCGCLVTSWGLLCRHCRHCRGLVGCERVLAGEGLRLRMREVWMSGCRMWCARMVGAAGMEGEGWERFHA